MQSDWNSLYFRNYPHADHHARDERMLRDIGLTRTESGELALAEDPTHLVVAPRRSEDRWHWLLALAALILPQGASQRDLQNLGRP